jgi:hypothetical protein
MKLLIVCFLLGFGANVYAQSLYAPDGTYLGEMNRNKYDPNSISNPYGEYGSKYSPKSINNPYGVYGSKYSDQSPNNPYINRY